MNKTNSDQYLSDILSTDTLRSIFNVELKTSYDGVDLIAKYRKWYSEKNGHDDPNKNWEIAKDMAESEHGEEFLSNEEIRNYYYDILFSIEFGHRADLTKGIEAMKHFLRLVCCTPENEWTGINEDDFNEIKRIGINEKIKWSSIKFIDYLYRLDRSRNPSCCVGELYFRCRKKTYKLHIITLEVDGEWRLLRLFDLVASEEHR